MSPAENLPTLFELESVATFFVDQAFADVHEACFGTLAGTLFGKHLDPVEPDPNWIPPRAPGSLAEWAAPRANEQPDLDPTLLRINNAWQATLIEAKTSSARLKPGEKITSPYIISHVMLLAAAVESIVNRHLFFLKEDGKMESTHYNAMDRAEILPKILFLFKDQVEARTLDLSAIRNLVKLRNHAVHYRPASVDNIVPRGRELFEIWRGISRLCGHLPGEPSSQYVENHAASVRERWFEP